jgi:pimeloyl-ACP methyl ester carboxylesterase
LVSDVHAMKLDEILPSSPYIRITDVSDASRLTLFLSYRRIPPGKFGGSHIGEKVSGTKLYLNCPDNWYCGGIPGVGETWREVLATLERIIAAIGPSEVQAVGSSMGGYGALSLGGQLGLDRVVALAPEIRLGARGSRSEEDVPSLDHAEIYARLRQDLPRAKQVSIFLGDLEPIDCLSATLARDIGVHNLNVMRGVPHEVAEALSPERRLISILDGRDAVAVEEAASAPILSERDANLAQLAFVRYRARDLDGAQRLLQALNAGQEVPTAIPFFLGRVLLEMKDVEGAVRQLGHALRLAPESLPVLHWMGRVLLDAGRPEEAIVYLRRHLELRPRNLAVLDLLATAHAMVGDHDTAEECLLRAIELEPSSSYKDRLAKLRTRASPERA